METAKTTIMKLRDITLEIFEKEEFNKPYITEERFNKLYAKYKQKI